MVISVKNADFSLKKMSLWQVVIIGVAYMTPMVVFDTFGIVSGITDGRVPLAYILALVAMLLTAFSYARFSRISGDSGSAYNYTAQSCGAKAGFFVGWCSLLDYILLPLVNALLASIYLEAVIPSVPYWLFCFLCSFGSRHPCFGAKTSSRKILRLVKKGYFLIIFSTHLFI
jgi:putrescine importer